MVFYKRNGEIKRSQFSCAACAAFAGFEQNIQKIDGREIFAKQPNGFPMCDAFISSNQTRSNSKGIGSAQSHKRHRGGRQFSEKDLQRFLRGFINLLAAGKHNKIGPVFHITMGQNAV